MTDQAAKEMFAKIISAKGERALAETFKPATKELSGQILDVSNPLKARPGCVVKLKWQDTGRIRDNVLLVLPVAGAVAAGALFGYYMGVRLKLAAEQGILGGVAIWSLLGLSYSYRHWRDNYGRGVQPTVVDIIR